MAVRETKRWWCDRRRIDENGEVDEEDKAGIDGTQKDGEERLELLRIEDAIEMKQT